MADVDTKGFTKRIGRVKALLGELKCLWSSSLTCTSSVHAQLVADHGSGRVPSPDCRRQRAVRNVVVLHPLELWTQKSPSSISDDGADEALTAWAEGLCKTGNLSQLHLVFEQIGSLQILLLSIVNPPETQVWGVAASFLEWAREQGPLVDQAECASPAGFFRIHWRRHCWAPNDKIRDLLKESIPQLIDAANTHGLRVDVADWASKICVTMSLQQNCLHLFKRHSTSNRTAHCRG